MKYLSLVVVLCGMASFAAAPAGAFEIQGKNASLEDGASAAGVAGFSAPVSPYLGTPDFSQGSSLALPYIGKSDSSSFVPSYGNMISIPGPGIDKPAPAWAYR
jgi:hypothetical protein